MAIKAKQRKAEAELEKLKAKKVEWESKEKGYLVTISKKEDRACDHEAEFHYLHT